MNEKEKKEFKLDLKKAFTCVCVAFMLVSSFGSMKHTNEIESLNKVIDAQGKTIQTLVEQQIRLEDELECMKSIPAEIAEEPIDTYSNVSYDYNYVVSAIAGECGDEPYEGQVAVAQVVLNRSKEWGMTPEEVVRQPGQFIAKPKALEDISTKTWQACDAVFFNGEGVTDYNIKWFCTVGCNSEFHNGLHYVFTIGNHNFYE